MPTDNSATTISIQRVTSAADLEAVYRFRYSIYVEEMRRPQRYALHAERTILDPLDVSAHVFSATVNGCVVGTVRCNVLARSDVGHYLVLYGLNELPHDLRRSTTITTRLMVAPRYRHGTLATRLASAIYEFGLRIGITQDFIDCNPPLDIFFTRLGYLRHKTDVLHPEYGSVCVMRLNLTDANHLRQIGSPFMRRYERVTACTSVGPACLC
jgi:hypothetical protein